MRAKFPGLVLSFNLMLMAASCTPAMDGGAPDPDRSERGSGGKSQAQGGSGGGSGGEASGGSRGEGSGGDRAGGSGNTGGAGAGSGGAGAGQPDAGSGGRGASGGSGGSAVAGSGGAGGGTTTGRPDGAVADATAMTGDDAAAAGPTFTKLWTELLLPTCGTAACHGRKGPPDGIDMHTQMTAYATLLAKAAIVKGNPVRSKIVTLIETKKMPPGGKPTVSAQQIADLKAWITAGALDD
jgi:hypothetical protein